MSVLILTLKWLTLKRRQLKGHKKGRSFGPNLKKMVCQQLIKKGCTYVEKYKVSWLLTPVMDPLWYRNGSITGVNNCDTLSF